ncbi:MAG: GNAT family N-acetyltransferase [Clostridia bacterium]|nr:GNAT family N-acetyltransferase [Clostridia bacterium]
MDKQKELATQFLSELKSGNRITYIYKIDGMFVGEISLVFDEGDSDYTIKNQRVYVSRLVVKKTYRRTGIGKKLIEFISDLAKEMKYRELSIGVDMDNYPALKLYADQGFNKIIFVGEDEQGKYMKLIKEL